MAKSKRLFLLLTLLTITTGRTAFATQTEFDGNGRASTCDSAKQSAEEIALAGCHEEWNQCEVVSSRGQMMNNVCDWHARAKGAE